MCFSAEASFTAAAVLTVTGIVTLRTTTSPVQFCFALIPLLFAIQQFSEGFIWLYLKHEIGSQFLFAISKKTFLIFAFLIWPIWIPLSFLLIEPKNSRRLLLWFNLFIGLGLSILYITYVKNQEMSVLVVKNSIQYRGEFPHPNLLTILYVTSVLLPIFISSLKNVWIFGILIAIAYLIAEYFYAATFFSVWCFFSAIVSLTIYKIMKENQYSLEEKPRF